MGPLYPRKSGTHREILCYDFRTFYRADHESNVVYIARVWHGRQDLIQLDI